MFDEDGNPIGVDDPHAVEAETNEMGGGGTPTHG